MASVEKLNAKHRDYELSADAWSNIEILACGGHEIRRHAGNFLVRRPKEPNEIYSARLERFTYENILGAGVGWYRSALFGKEPEIDRKGAGDDDFYGRFLKDCDRAGTKFTDFLSSMFRNLVLFGRAYVLTDLPQPAEQPETLAQQKAQGGLDPYLVNYSPTQVRNWELDSYGNLLWVVIYTANTTTDFLGDNVKVERWTHYTTTQFTVYERRTSEGQKPAAEADTVSEGRHALADKSRVPVRRIAVPDELWLANRAYLQVLDHLNADNSLGWALLMAALAMPVLITDEEVKPNLSEVGYIKLSKGSDFKWSEPAGTTFEVQERRVRALVEEIYRQMHIHAQGRSSEATPAMQSGYSKELDMAPSRDVLAAYGDVIRGGAGLILRDVADARGDEVEFEVRGFDFDPGPGPEEIQGAKSIQEMEIQSDTFDRELQKRVARAYLRDAESQTIEAVMSEINAAPSRSEREKRRAAEMEASMKSAFGAAATAA